MVTLDDVFAEVVRVRQLVEGSAFCRLSRVDQARLGAILPVVAATVGSAPFLVRELLGLESAGLRLVLAGLSAKALGKLLRRGEGVPVAGLVVEQVGVEAGAMLWKVSEVLSVVSGPVKASRSLASGFSRR